jgi:hypothetical protein
MTRANRTLGILVVGCLAFSTLACGAVGNAGARIKTTNDIKQVSLSYLSFIDDKKAPPADEKAFAAWVAAKQPEAAPAFANLQAGGYKVYWGVNPLKLTAGSTNTVLIYPGDAPSNGGLVGFADGSVRAVMAAEFNAAAKPPMK